MKWFIVVSVVSVFSNSQGQNLSSWCSNIETDLSTCINQNLNGLPTIGNQFTDASRVLDVQSLVTSVFSTICQPATLTAMDNFYGCIYGKMWTCIPLEWKNVFPDLDKAKGALRFMCDNVNDVDLTCLTKTENTLKLAACLLGGISYPADVTADTYLKLTCSLTAKYTVCTEIAYGACTKRTAEVMKKAYEYQIPPGCDACMAKPSIILLIAFLILAFVKKINY